MRLSILKIEKFRSIKKATLNLKQIMAIVGANNVGKSHVLRALNAFFNFQDEKESLLNESHRYSKSARPTITVTFSDIDKDEVDAKYIHNNKLIIKFTYKWDRKNPIYEVIRGSDKSTIDSETFRNITKSFNYIYIPIIRNYDAAFSSSTGIAYKLLKQIFDSATINRNTIQPLADKLIKKVEKSIYKPAISKILNYYPFSKESRFELHTFNADLVDLILKNVTLMYLEDSQENSIDNCGSGVQSAVFFAISIALSFVPDKYFLVGIDEPELNMHPQAQRLLIESLRNNKKYPNTSFILTTHSTVIIDRLGHESIALCRKNKDVHRAIITDIYQTPNDFWKKYDFEEERYYNFFDFKNSDFFFSKFIIITESSNDCKVMQNILELSGIDLEEEGISLIPAEGERSIKYPYAIAKELDIPFLTIVDRDVFQAYVNNKREDSLDNYGIPQYKSELKTSSPILELMATKDKAVLLEALNSNKFEDVLSVLWKYRIITMKYALEVDLMTCQSYCQEFYTILGLRSAEEHIEKQKELLTTYGNKIKKYTLINQVINIKGVKNLPKSYRAVINRVKEMIGG